MIAAPCHNGRELLFMICQDKVFHICYDKYQNQWGCDDEASRLCRTEIEFQCTMRGF